jgi:periplasmic protein TonB
VTAKRKKHRCLPIALLGLGVLTIGAGTFALVRSFLSGGTGQTQKVVQEIHLIRPPPPPPDVPPPPPPPEEKLITPEPQQHPDPTPSNEPPPSEHLGLDAEGSAGGDAFGLMGNKGGRDLIGSGGGSVFAWYSGILKNAVQEQLSSEKQLRGGSYTLTVRFWLREDGSIDHHVIVQGSGDRERDRVIEASLSRMTRLPNAPPAGYPSSATLTVVSHG